MREENQDEGGREEGRGFLYGHACTTQQYPTDVGGPRLDPGCLAAVFPGWWGLVGLRGFVVEFGGVR
jgi:hypothetical protein